MLLIALATTSLLAAAPPAAKAPEIEAGARAARRCAACHAVGGETRSPNAGAPTFREIRLRYNALSLERELARIAEHGHFDMKPMSIQPSEAEALAAYIESLGPPR